MGTDKQVAMGTIRDGRKSVTVDWRYLGHYDNRGTTLVYKQIPRSSRRNPLPMKRINGLLLMGPEHPAGARVELMQIRKTPSGTDRILHDPPEAFNRMQMMAAMRR